MPPQTTLAILAALLLIAHWLVPIPKLLLGRGLWSFACRAERQCSVGVDSVAAPFDIELGRGKRVAPPEPSTHGRPHSHHTAAAPAGQR